MFKVLIVDDEHLLRAELAMAFDWAAHGCRVSGMAANGREALEMALAEPPDIVFTDIRMPEMDGLALIDALRKRMQAVYIVISGFNEFEYAVRALQYGVLDYLLKPIEHERLCACVTDAVERARLIRAVEAPDPADIENIQGGNLYVRHAAQYIREHYGENLRLAQVAEQLYITESYLSKLFIREFGMRFTEYLGRVRIAKSIPLLKNPQLKIYDVAERVGFCDQQYYCVVFRKVMGMTPQQYRHNAQGR